MIAALPILMGTAIAGDGQSAGNIFNSNANIKTGEFQGFLLIGALMFQLVSNTLWNFGFWLRREQTTGTLESGVYLVPTSKFYLVTGSALYVLVRNSISFVLALVLGVIIFSIQANYFLQSTIFLGIFFLLIGLPPLIGLSLLFGSLILRFQEVGVFIELIQWILGLLMGIFFPISVLPLFIKVFSFLIPLSWTLNEIRAVLFQSDFFVTFWIDLIISLGYMIIVPIIAFILFYKVEKGILLTSGVGKY
jgi:ABC-2 type transport system permease protein